jgi:hypothetical protein
LLETIKSSSRDDIYRHAGRAQQRLNTIEHDGAAMPSQPLGKEADEAARDIWDVVASARDHARSAALDKAGAKVPHANVDEKAAQKRINDAPDSRRVEHWDPLLKALHDLANPKPAQAIPRPSHPPAQVAAPKPAPPPELVPVPKGGSFEEVAAAVARNIASKVKDVQCEEADEIAKLLALLAEAAKQGNRQKLIECARGIAEKGKLYSNRLRNYAGRVPGKTAPEREVQDIMLRAATLMGSYGMQLKILCSVKAAKLESNKDQDETLNSLVREVGAIVTAGLEAIDVTRKTIFKADV